MSSNKILTLPASGDFFVAVSFDDQAYLGKMSAYRFAEEDGGLHTIIGIIETRDRVSRAKTVAIQAEITSDGSIVELWGLGLPAPNGCAQPATRSKSSSVLKTSKAQQATSSSSESMDVAPFRLLWTRS